MSTNEERNWIIYMYTFPNGKRYVGKTSKSLKERQEGPSWSGYSNSTVLMRAVRKYGVENIQQDILFEGFMTDEYSSRLEMMCILLFKTNCRRFKNPQYGYNTTDGGEGTLGHRHTEETKKKMSKSRKGTRIGKDAINSKPVYCIELDRVFVNAVEAEKYTGISKQSISLCCLRKYKSTRGGNTKFNVLHWIFEKDKSADIIEEIMCKPKIVFCQNTSSGVNGVYFDNSKKKWAAFIAYDKRRYFLGRYLDKNDAIIARLSAEKMYYGDSAPQAYLFNKYKIE